MYLAWQPPETLQVNGLPPLPPLPLTSRDLICSHRGPTARSNWVVPGRLLAGDRASLDDEASLKAVMATGVSMIVCLQSRSEVKLAVDYRPRAVALNPELRVREQPIPDQEVIEDSLIEELLVLLLESFAAGEIIYVHCRGGHGRTGTVCCLLLGQLYRISGAEALIRIQRFHDTRKIYVFSASGEIPPLPGSLCASQVDAPDLWDAATAPRDVLDWAATSAPALFAPQHLQVLRLLPCHQGTWALQEQPVHKEETERTPSAPSVSSRSLPRFVMLMGLPGSGKSTFSEQLVQSGRGWIRICQDEAGGREAVESALGSAGKDTSKRVILDRCNEVQADRRYLMELAFSPKPAVLVHFAVDAEVCESRVAARTNHPTIPYGGGRGAVRSKAAALELPTVQESFDEIIVVRTFEEANNLLSRWGAQPPHNLSPPGLVRLCSPLLLPCPRTQAPLAGEAMMSAPEATWFCGNRAVIIEEWPLDGLPCAVSITRDYEVQLQDATSYLALDFAQAGDALWRDELQHLIAWREKYGTTICQVLEPEFEVLVGLWCRQRRQKAGETKESRGFVALEFYEKRSARRYSTRERDRRLQHSGIPTAPRLAERSFADLEELESVLSGVTSKFTGGEALGAFVCLDEAVESSGGLWQERRARVALRPHLHGGA